jgi:hypothetical protein
MKTYNNLYSDVCAFANLYQAWRSARRGKRYEPAPAAFERQQHGRAEARPYNG